MPASRSWASLDGCFEGVLGLGVGVEGFPFSMPIDLSLIDHGLVARKPWLGLDYAVQRFKEAHVPWNGGVVDHIDRIDELSRGG